MRYSFLFLLTVFSTALVGQNYDWFGHNPKWEVYFTAGFAGSALETVTIQGDTVVGGRSAKIFSRSNSILPRISILAQSGDSIFLWHHDEAKYYLNYDMSAPVGTVFSQPRLYGSSNITFSVVDTGTIQIGTQTLRIQKWTDAQLSAERFVIEGIGLVYLLWQNGSVYPQHFFWNEPDNSAVDGEAWALCEFTNDLVDYDPTPNVDLCFGLVNTPTPEHDVAVTVFPNPAADFVQFEIPAGVENYQLLIFDVFGRKLRHSVDFQRSLRIDKEHLPSGTYAYILINTGGETLKTGTFVFTE